MTPVVTDAWRLAVGTLTAIPVPPPRAVDAQRAGWAMSLAVPAALPLGVLAGLVAVVGGAAGAPSLLLGLLVVGALALASRGLHLDGLADTADGLAASYDPARSLQVMRSGASGPAGVTALVLVLGLQATGLSSLLQGVDARSGVLVGLLVCASRGALVLTCCRGVPGARSDGLGTPYAQSVGPARAVALWVALTVLVALVVAWTGGPWWRGVLAVLLAAALVGALVVKVVRRFGGVTGDVYGAAVEVCLATFLVVLS